MKFTVALLSLMTASQLFANELLRSRDTKNVPAAHWAEAFGVDPLQEPNTFSTNGRMRVLLNASSEPTNILWPGEQPELQVLVTNSTATPITGKASVLVVAYESYTFEGELFRYGARKLFEVPGVPVTLNVPANGTQELLVKPPVPDRNGGFAVLLQVEGEAHRLFITSMARTFKPEFQKRQFYKLTMDLSDPAVLLRLGAAPNRVGMSPRGPNDPRVEEYYQQQAANLRRYQEAGLPIAIEFGHGASFHGETVPLGRNRPFLDDKGVMFENRGFGDIVWMPEFDDNFAAFVKRLLLEFGWPRGPVNAVKIWNEPWNGGSIGGWGADDERFREMTIAMDKGVRAARAEAGVQVLQGGADSSSNTLDKYFGDGKDTFMPMFDFLSVHYQGNDPHTNWRAWRERKNPDGTPNPILFWDTESWAGNTDERIAATLASMYSYGQDRAVGIDSSYTVTRSFRRPAGMITHAYGPAAAVGAFQHLVGEDRPFEKLHWHGLPFLMRFNGRSGNVEDSTIVVVGDLGYMNPDVVAMRTARSLVEVQGKREIRKRLADMPAHHPERRALELRLLAAWPHAGATMSLQTAGDAFQLLDFYGNPIPPVDGKLVIPLSERGYYLRGSGTPGSFAALTRAIDEAQIDGFEPLEKKIRDFTARIEDRPVLRMELRNVLNRPVTGTLKLNMRGVELEYPESVSFAAHEGKVIEARVVSGVTHPENLYPLHFLFDAGNGVIAETFEDMRVNLISRRTVAIDGDLRDWEGVIPQQIRIDEQASATFTETAWRPYETFADGPVKGFSLGYLAWDDENFYFAAKISDTTEHPGGLRFDMRDDDEFFYPEVTLQKAKPPQVQGGTNFSARWTGFLQAAKTGKHTLILNTDDGVRMWLDDELVIDFWKGRGAADSTTEVELTAGKRVPIRIEYFQGGGGATARFDWIELGGARRPVPSTNLFTAAEGGPSGLNAEFFAGTGLTGTAKLTRIDASINYRSWPTLPWVAPAPLETETVFEELRWPEGVRRYSYRKDPDLPAGHGQGTNLDNVQIGFNVMPEERKPKISVLPGLIPDYMSYTCTDYEWALNRVADAYGGGTEVWRLRRPDLPHKHFYPRNPKAPGEGPAPGAQLVVKYENGWRIVEAAIPWTDMPEAKARLDAGQTVKFSYRVNDDQGVGCMELAKRRSVAKRNTSFFVDWVEHWANELKFAAEPAR